MSTNNKMDIGELFRKSFEQYSPEVSDGGFAAMQERMRLRSRRVRRLRLASGAAALAVVASLWFLWPQSVQDGVAVADDPVELSDGHSSDQPVEQESPVAPTPADRHDQPVTTATGSGPSLPEGPQARPEAAGEPVPRTPVTEAVNGQDPVVVATPERRQAGSNTLQPRMGGIEDGDQEKASAVIFVSSDTTICLGQSVTLEAEGGRSYAWSDGSSNAFLTVAPERTTVYRLEVTDDQNITHTYSIMVEVRDCAELIVPSAFTPNYDGRNDVFLPVGRAVDEYTLRIYARSGELVYESDDFYRGWNGEVSGSLASPGAFIYVITYVNRLGEPVVKRGTVTLLP